MNKSLQTKLDQLIDRYEELAALMSDSEIISDQDKFRAYSKEYADIEPVVNCFRQYEDETTQLEDAKSMASDSDPEIREMAEAEIEELSASLEKLDSTLQTLLLPKDPHDANDRIQLTRHDLRQAVQGQINTVICFECIPDLARLKNGKWKFSTNVTVNMAAIKK